LEGGVLEVDNLGLLHLVVEVVALAGTLTDAGENRQTRVLQRDVVDQLHHVDGLAHAGAAEEADLAALGEGQTRSMTLMPVSRSSSDAAALRRWAPRWIDAALLLTDRAALVDGITEHVHDAAQGLAADGHGDRRAGVLNREAAGDAFGGAHGDGAYDTVAELLLHFEGQSFFRDLKCVINLRHRVAWKLHVDNRADDLYDSSATHVRSSLLKFTG
jgi:hypothetical protein